jgi:transcriptional regulator with XRE-family HTH domain
MKTISTPQELELLLGENIKALRLQKNLDRKTLCRQADISENALRHLEAGQGTTIKTLVRVLRALDRQEWISSIAPTASINPLHMVQDNQVRQRARVRRSVK